MIVHYEDRTYETHDDGKTFQTMPGLGSFRGTIIGRLARDLRMAYADSMGHDVPYPEEEQGPGHESGDDSGGEYEVWRYDCQCGSTWSPERHGFVHPDKCPLCGKSQVFAEVLRFPRRDNAADPQDHPAPRTLALLIDTGEGYELQPLESKHIRGPNGALWTS